MKTADISDKQVCEAYVKAKVSGEWPFDVLVLDFEAPWKVAVAACERAANRGFIDYGINLRTGWLTPAGRELLDPDALRTYEQYQRGKRCSISY